MAKFGSRAVLVLILSLAAGPVFAWPSSNEGVQQPVNSTQPAGDPQKTCDRTKEGEDWLKGDDRVKGVKSALDTLLLEWANVDKDKKLFGGDTVAKDAAKTQLVGRTADFTELARTSAVRLKESCKKCAVLNNWRMLKSMAALTPGKVMHSSNRELWIQLDSVTEKMLELGANNFDNFVKYRAEQKKFVGNDDIQKKITREIDDIVFYTSDAIVKNTDPTGPKMADRDGKWFCYNFYNPFD
jgi:hypothetical protein